VRPFSVRAHNDNLLLFLVKPRSASIDLSNTTKLKEVAFQPISRSVNWIPATLRTASKLQDLREISIHLPYYVTTTDAGADVREAIEEEDWEEWLDLDRLLAQFWESSLFGQRSYAQRGWRVRGTQEIVLGTSVCFQR
jgi:hypothetical protein